MVFSSDVKDDWEFCGMDIRSTIDSPKAQGVKRLSAFITLLVLYIGSASTGLTKPNRPKSLSNPTIDRDVFDRFQSQSRRKGGTSILSAVGSTARTGDLDVVTLQQAGQKDGSVSAGRKEDASPAGVQQGAQTNGDSILQILLKCWTGSLPFAIGFNIILERVRNLQTALVARWRPQTPLLAVDVDMYIMKTKVRIGYWLYPSGSIAEGLPNESKKLIGARIKKAGYIGSTLIELSWAYNKHPRKSKLSKEKLLKKLQEEKRYETRKYEPLSLYSGNAFETAGVKDAGSQGDGSAKAAAKGFGPGPDIVSSYTASSSTVAMDSPPNVVHEPEKVAQYVAQVSDESKGPNTSEADRKSAAHDDKIPMIGINTKELYFSYKFNLLLYDMNRCVEVEVPFRNNPFGIKERLWKCAESATKPVVTGSSSSTPGSSATANATTAADVPTDSLPMESKLQIMTLEDNEALKLGKSAPKFWDENDRKSTEKLKYVFWHDLEGAIYHSTRNPAEIPAITATLKVKTSQTESGIEKDSSVTQSELFSLEDRRMRENIENTISKFPGARVNLVDDTVCANIIEASSSDLFKGLKWVPSQSGRRDLENFFDERHVSKVAFKELLRKEMDMTSKEMLAFLKAEPIGKIKSDFCRLFMLYETGGIYFDNDLLVRFDARQLLDFSKRFGQIPETKVEPKEDDKKKRVRDLVRTRRQRNLRATFTGADNLLSSNLARESALLGIVDSGVHSVTKKRKSKLKRKTDGVPKKWRYKAPSKASKALKRKLADAASKNDAFSVVSFASVLEAAGDGIFQAFMAVGPKHPLIRASIRMFAQYYAGQRPVVKDNIGPDIMRQAYLAWSGEKTIEPGFIVHGSNEYQLMEGGQSGTTPARRRQLSEALEDLKSTTPDPPEKKLSTLDAIALQNNQSAALSDDRGSKTRFKHATLFFKEVKFRPEHGLIVVPADWKLGPGVSASSITKSDLHLIGSLFYTENSNKTDTNTSNSISLGPKFGRFISRYKDRRVVDLNRILSLQKAFPKASLQELEAKDAVQIAKEKRQHVHRLEIDPSKKSGGNASCFTDPTQGYILDIGYLVPQSDPFSRCCCNYVVLDPVSGLIPFYSRMEGSPQC